jgi:signal peptidase I
MQLPSDTDTRASQRADEIDRATHPAHEPPPALPSGNATRASRHALTGVEPPSALPSPRVETWRPSAITPPDEDVDHEQRSRERRARLERARWVGALWTSLKIGVVLFITYGMVFNFSIVRGSSMSPGIHDGDRILVDHLTLMFRDVHRGDIVVLQYPLDPTLDYIKRVIGLPGDEVRIEGDRVWVNGEPLQEPYIAEPDPRTHLRQTVAPDCFFVMGDNRQHSSDSREFGQVPRDNLIGLVNLRVWPPARVGVLD